MMRSIRKQNEHTDSQKNRKQESTHSSDIYSKRAGGILGFWILDPSRIEINIRLCIATCSYATGRSMHSRSALASELSIFLGNRLLGSSRHLVLLDPTGLSRFREFDLKVWKLQVPAGRGSCQPVWQLQSQSQPPHFT